MQRTVLDILKKIRFKICVTCRKHETIFDFFRKNRICRMCNNCSHKRKKEYSSKIICNIMSKFLWNEDYEPWEYIEMFQQHSFSKNMIDCY